MDDAAFMNPPQLHSDDRQLTDAAVVAKTGKKWSEWFAILDATGGEQMDHMQIVAYLYRAHVLSPWWQQMVAVTYEQERAGRLRHGQADGLEVVASKTVGASITETFEYWADPGKRRRWLDADSDAQRAIPERSVRISLDAGNTYWDVEFHPRIDGTCQVTVQSDGAQGFEQAEATKAFWTQALNRLVALLVRSTGP
jgi:hypothetical protein